MNTLADILRRARKSLVIAAEAAIEEAVKSGISLPEKSQLNQLAAICNEATCAEEIESFIRYQAGRPSGKSTLWDRRFAELVIQNIADPLAQIENNFYGSDTAKEEETKIDAAKVDAWRLYAVYMTRAYTWHTATSNTRDRRAANQGGRR